MKIGGRLFDVTMGAFDDAEICELIGCYLLPQVSATFSKEIFGPYREIGFAIFLNIIVL